MRILFLTINQINTISGRGIYKDLLRKFRDERHDVFIVAPSERRFKKKTVMFKNEGVSVILVRTLNIRQTNFIEKGLATILIEFQYERAIKKYLSEIQFDLILYTTPPITLTKIISYITHRTNALSYLLLKDIFPQNAVDLGIIAKGSLLYRYFRLKERRLYSISDYIGCMSPANVDYIRKNNPQINPDKIEVNPNTIEPVNEFINLDQKLLIRNKYQIPSDPTIFIFGGNIGKPQGIDFIIDTLDSQQCNLNSFFIIAGSGSEFPKLIRWYKDVKPFNTLIISSIPKHEFDLLIQVCDVGLIFLDKRFSIPNFPSRLLNYLEFKMPVIAATDTNTDIGRIIVENGFGLWSEAGDLLGICKNIDTLSSNKELCTQMGQKGYEYLVNNYSVSNSYKIILNHFKLDHNKLNYDNHI